MARNTKNQPKKRRRSAHAVREAEAQGNEQGM